MVATPEQVMKLYMNKLTPYEHHEIFNYPQIYFIGANAKKRPGIIGGPNNCGYDDEQVSFRQRGILRIVLRSQIKGKLLCLKKNLSLASYVFSVRFFKVLEEFATPSKTF